MGKRIFSCDSTFARRFKPSLYLLAAMAFFLLSSCRDVDVPTRPDGGSADSSDRNELAISLATVPAQFQETIVTSGLAYPTTMAMAPDGRIFVCEQGGRLRVVKNGALLSTPFMTLSVSSNGERGLLGVAFDPQFASNRYLYVYYTTANSTVRNRVSRFTASLSNPDVVSSGSEFVMLDLNPVSASNHNGGALHFGPDGKLYIAVGENAVPSNSQSLGNLLGKMLRINKDGSIPTDNPFYNSATGYNRAIWALGLRNPFTFNFQPGSGRMFINDVGQDSWEEINEGAAGANYGWPATEGPTTNPSYRTPFHTYSNAGSNCAIVGAAFYNPANPVFPSNYVGDYFFGDYCGGWIRSIDPGTKSVVDFASGIYGLVDVMIGDDGALYYLSAGSGRLARIAYVGGGGTPPSITTHPANATATSGGSATFLVAATGTAPLAFQWQRDGADIAGAMGTSYTLSNTQSTDNGARFRVVVSNSHGTAVSNEAILTVSANRPPTSNITAPATGTSYQGGQTINYSGTGTDPDQGNLPASAFSWRADLHHETHIHPFLLPVSGSVSGTLTFPTEGETSANVFYRLHLTVTDAEGATHSSSVDILPRKADVTLATQPAGLRLKLDGMTFTTPFTFTGVVGMRRTLAVESPQTSGGSTYNFLSWSDGGAATHVVSTPASATTYTATYSTAPSGPNQGPRSAILTPAAGYLWDAGTDIAFSGSATDPEEGNLGGGAFTWYVEIIHGYHTHPVLGATTGSTTGSFTASAAGQLNHTTGQQDHAYWYRISLKVTDAGGLTHWSYLDIQPRKANITLASSPTGLQLKLDGFAVNAPHVFTGVVGVQRTLSVVTPQTLEGRSWAFVGWSDGGAATHVIATPAAATTFTAEYQ